MFGTDLVDDVEDAAVAFVVFVVWVRSAGDGLWHHSPLWLTLRLLEAPVTDARADPLEESTVLDVIPDASPVVVVERTEVVDGLEEMGLLGIIELDDEVDVQAPWALASFPCNRLAMTTSR